MNQTRFESAIETFCNYASGFVVAYLVYAWIVMPSPWLKDSPFWVTTLFTVVSVTCSYLWRRFFNAGLHKVVASVFAVKRNKDACPKCCSFCVVPDYSFYQDNDASHVRPPQVCLVCGHEWGGYP